MPFKGLLQVPQTLKCITSSAPGAPVIHLSKPILTHDTGTQRLHCISGGSAPRIIRKTNMMQLGPRWASCLPPHPRRCRCRRRRARAPRPARRPWPRPPCARRPPRPRVCHGRHSPAHPPRRRDALSGRAWGHRWCLDLGLDCQGVVPARPAVDSTGMADPLHGKLAASKTAHHMVTQSCRGTCSLGRQKT